nr:MAG TPA: hypothetical protein [Caudoviricetes sp.]
MTTENQHSAPDYAGAHRGMFWGERRSKPSRRRRLAMSTRPDLVARLCSPPKHFSRISG